MVNRIRALFAAAASISFILLLFSCSEETSDYSAAAESELRIDSVSVCIIRAPHPYDGSPAGHVNWDIYYQFGGNPGAISRVQIYVSPPGEYTFGVKYNSIFNSAPLAVDTPYELHDDLWLQCDYSDYDSIWVYFAVEATFWRELESLIQNNTIHFSHGDDRWFANMKIDIRDE